MNKKLKIYEGGKMSGLSYKEMNDWRERLKSLLEYYASYSSVNLTVINPVDYYNFEEKRYQSHREVMLYDLAHVKSSDLMVVNLDGLNSSIGTCIELYAAYESNIPVVALGTKELYDSLHPWIKEYITRVEDTDEEVVSYIIDFYFAD